MSSMSKSLLLIIAMLSLPLIAGCAFQARFHETQDGRYIPEGLGDGLPYPSDSPAAQLDFDALYVYRGEQSSTPHQWMRWLRFWPAGRSLKSRDLRTSELGIDAALGDDFAGGYPGRYVIQGRILVMEIWYPDSGQMAWVFFTHRYEITPAGDLTLLSTQMNGGRANPHKPTSASITYRRVHIAGMKRQPDW